MELLGTLKLSSGDYPKMFSSWFSSSQFHSIDDTNLLNCSKSLELHSVFAKSFATLKKQGYWSGSCGSCFIAVPQPTHQLIEVQPNQSLASVPTVVCLPTNGREILEASCLWSTWILVQRSLPGWAKTRHPLQRGLLYKVINCDTRPDFERNREVGAQKCKRQNSRCILTSCLKHWFQEQPNDFWFCEDLSRGHLLPQKGRERKQKAWGRHLCA